MARRLVAEKRSDWPRPSRQLILILLAVALTAIVPSQSESAAVEPYPVLLLRQSGSALREARLNRDGNLFVVQNGSPAAVLYQTPELPGANPIFSAGGTIGTYQLTGFDTLEPLWPLLESDKIIVKGFAQGTNPTGTTGVVAIIDGQGTTLDALFSREAPFSAVSGGQFASPHGFESESGDLLWSFFITTGAPIPTPYFTRYLDSQGQGTTGNLDIGYYPQFIDLFGVSFDAETNGIRILGPNTGTPVPGTTASDQILGVTILPPSAPENPFVPGPITVQVSSPFNTLPFEGATAFTSGTFSDIYENRALSEGLNLVAGELSAGGTQAIVLSSGAIPDQPRTCAADGNGDKVVNASDYTVWRANLGRTDAQGALEGDYDGNGTVDLADYETWAHNFGGTCGLPKRAGEEPPPAGVTPGFRNPNIGIILMQTGDPIPAWSPRVMQSVFATAASESGVAAMWITATVAPPIEAAIVVFDNRGLTTVLKTGDDFGDGEIESIMALSNMNEAGQFAVTVQLAGNSQAIYRFQGNPGSGPAENRATARWMSLP